MARRRRSRKARDGRWFSRKAGTAVHEAAHACAAIYVGRGLCQVDICDGNDEWNGVTTFQALAADARRERALAEIVTYLAGHVAEQIATGSERIPLGAESDLKDACLWCMRIGADLPVMLDVTRRISLRKRHWQRIERVASVLLDERRLTGSEVRRLYLAA